MRSLTLLVFTIGCGAESAATVVEVPVVTATIAATPAWHDCSHAPPMVGCTELARIRVGAIELSDSKCYVDSTVRGDDVGRVLQCNAGTVVVFDRGAFGGSLDGPNLKACHTTQFPFSDGCTWEAVEQIHGTLRSGLSYSYSEHAISGDRCSPASCKAHATLTVE